MSAVGIPEVQAIINAVYAVKAYPGEKPLVITDSPNPSYGEMSLSQGKLFLRLHKKCLNANPFPTSFDTSKPGTISIVIHENTKEINLQIGFLVKFLRIYNLFIVLLQEKFTIQSDKMLTNMCVIFTNQKGQKYEINITYNDNRILADFMLVNFRFLPENGTIYDGNDISKLYPALVKFFTPPKSFFSKQEEYHQLWCKIEQLTDALCERLDIH
jgi:hypothetical protein